VRIAAFTLILNLFFIVSEAQTFSFKSIAYDDHFEIQPFGDEVYCLFRVSEKNYPNTLFKKVFLDTMLAEVHAEVYEIEGKAKLLGSCSDEKFVTHAFYTKNGSSEKIIFIITDHSGKMTSTFHKATSDFSPYFQKPLKKLKNFQLTFIGNNGSPGELLIQPYELGGYLPVMGKIFSLNAEDGKELWASSVPPLSNIQTTGSLLIGMLSTPSGNNSNPVHQIYFVDKSNGNLIRSIPFASKGVGYRQVSVFATNGLQLMVAGSEFESSNTKNGKFFMTMYNLDGERIFDNVDSAARLSTKRLHLMGHTFDGNGNLVLIAESWKYDATRAVAATGMSILMAAAGVGYGGVYGGLDHKIDHVVFATMSPTDGSIKNFKTFPVGPWLDYGRLLTQGSHVLFAVSNNVIIYNVNEPNHAPAPFTSLKLNESLTLTPRGPLVNRRDGKNYTLRWLPQ
jgi:hypothetical protein